jgi:hypothetical protein
MNRRNFLAGLGALAAGLRDFLDDGLYLVPQSGKPIAARAIENVFKNGDIVEFVGVKGFEDGKPYRIHVD